MPNDLTGILLRRGALSDDDIERIVLARGYGDVLLRIAPLDAVGLTQVEVHGARDGLPCEDPALVEQLATGGLAAFVHVNHTASQAVIHSFHPGGSSHGPGFAGSPGDEFDARLRSDVGATLEAITAADDGSRLGIGIASSRTRAIVRGRKLAVPPGTPTDLNTFTFHDRAHALDGGERLALFAFDGAALGRRLETPGRELAAQLGAAPRGTYGPLEGVRAQVVAQLAELGDRPLLASRDVRAVELCTLDEALAFAGGDTVRYWDEHVLPLLTLVPGEPVVDREDVDELDGLSLLEALVEIMPSEAPPGGEGSMLASIGDGELGPLAPWARPGEEYAGTIFTLAPERLLDAARRFAGPQLGQWMEKLERAWYRAARPGQPEGDALATFRRALAEEGRADIDRALRDWAELRVVLELASANRLSVALFFYEGE